MFRFLIISKILVFAYKNVISETKPILSTHNRFYVQLRIKNHLFNPIIFIISYNLIVFISIKLWSFDKTLSLPIST